jgi:hypothetical protein
MTARMNRRMYGMVRKRLDEARLDEVPDPRDRRGQRWDLGALLRGVLGAMMAGAKSLAQVEEMSARMSRPIRRLLGTRRRLPDTTARTLLCSLDPKELRRPLHRLIRKACRRGALDPDVLPFGILSLDGKVFSLPSCDDWYAQRQTQGEQGPLVGVVRTITATLTSSPAKPVIDVLPIPAPTNEMGVFEKALDAVCEAYGGLELFQLITYDAGACSARNAAHVRKRGLHYLFGLTAAQPTLFEEAKRWLGSKPREQAEAVTEDIDHGKTVIRRLYLGEVTADVDGWQHLRTVVRVETETVDAGGRTVSRDDRYFLSSLPRVRLTPEHWLLAIRRHWGVETSHQVLDVSFLEDRHPWIKANPRGALVVAVLRRIAYTILTLFRSVTQRSEERRNVPWKALINDVFYAFITTTPEQVAGLRTHRLARC